MIYRFIECPSLNQNLFFPGTLSLNNSRQSYIITQKSSSILGFDLWNLFYPPALISEFKIEEIQEAEGVMFDIEEVVNVLIESNGVMERFIHDPPIFN